MMRNKDNGLFKTLYDNKIISLNNKTILLPRYLNLRYKLIYSLKKIYIYSKRTDFGTCSLSKLFDTQVARRGRQVPRNPPYKKENRSILVKLLNIIKLTLK